MKRVWQNDETGEIIEIAAEGDAKWHELPYFFLSQVGFGTLADWKEVPAESA